MIKFGFLFYFLDFSFIVVIIGALKVTVIILF